MYNPNARKVVMLWDGTKNSKVAWTNILLTIDLLKKKKKIDINILAQLEIDGTDVSPKEVVKEPSLPL